MKKYEQKFILFLKCCDQANILVEDHHKEFAIMLFERALKHFFDAFLSKSLNLEELVEAVNERFITPE